MNIGYQTIIWGPQIEDLRYVLDVISKAGFKGVEFAQRPDALGVKEEASAQRFEDRESRPIKDIAELLALLDEFGLELIGLMGGSLVERIEFCEEYRGGYLYVENWDPEWAAYALEESFTLALHPHIFTPIHRLTDAIDLLDEHRHENFKLLPDTAHYVIAGDDPIEALAIGVDRIAAVHLQDWTPEFGRFSHQYGKGFTELGEGIVKLGDFVEALRQVAYEGWLVVEQDYMRIDPAQNIIACARWLKKAGLLSRAPRRSKRPVPPHGLDVRPRERKSTPEMEERFLRSILHAGTEEIDACYETIARAFAELIPCHLVQVWAYSPAQHLKSLLAITPAPPVPILYTLDCDEVLSGETRDRKIVTRFDDLTKTVNGRRFGNPGLIDAMTLKTLVSIPILNPWNPNHVWMFISLFPKEDGLPVTDEELFFYGKYVSIAVSAVLTDLCSFAIARTNFYAGQSNSSAEFVDKLVRLIQELLHSEGVSIFLVNAVGDRLELKGTTGLHWHVKEEYDQFYKKGEGLTGWVWKENEQLLTQNARDETNRRVGKSHEIVKTEDKFVLLLVPFSDTKGRVIGIVRCRNKVVSDGTFNVFTDGDVAVLDAIGQAAVPHLQELLGEERRIRALGKLTHELKSPLVSIRGAADIMKTIGGYTDIFDHDYPESIWLWSELMRRLFGNADILRHTSEVLPIEPKATLLRGDIIAPAVQQVRMLLEERGFSKGRIYYGTFNEIPALNIDPDQFQQVLFNLLSNAIKYCHDNPKRFKVDINGVMENDEYVIRIQDYGPGIQEGLEKVIFEEGVRGPNAAAKDVTGQGLGLWIVRRIVEAHGGRVEVTKRRKPTEFTIYLPTALKAMEPKATRLLGDVVVPAIQQVKMLLEERGLSMRRIIYSVFSEIPPLSIDPDQFQQVMFNLLSNAIKYCHDDPKRFQVAILDAVKEGEYLIHIRDFGLGIQAGWEKVIFEKGTRGPNAVAKDGAGQGLGLWIVRRIVEAHGGRIDVTNTHQPTEFTIYLPATLKTGEAPGETQLIRERHDG